MHKQLIDRPEIEYIAGRAYPKVSPKLVHGITQFACAKMLERCSSRRGVVSTETRFHLLSGTELVPDVSFIAYSRFLGLSEDEVNAPPFAPDVAIEVRSPSDRPKLISEKTSQYLQQGTIIVLNVDPQSRSLTAHSAQGDAVAYSSGERFTSADLPWLAFDVDELFAGIDIPH